MPKSMLAGAVAALALAIPNSAQADGPAWKTFEGLYEPVGGDGVPWSCEMEELGQDGGSVGVIDGALFGVENRCDLKKPRLLSDGSVTFTSVCEAEGTQFTEEVTLTKTADGISLERSGRSVFWRSCYEASEAGNQTSTPDHDGTYGDWTSYYGMGWIEATTSDGLGNTVTFSCGEDQTQSYDGNVNVYLAGSAQKPGTIKFTVDGQSFTMNQDSDGGVNLDCPGCAQTFRSLWVAVSMGRSLSVTGHTGASATFSLNGSGAAMAFEVCAVGEPIE